MDVRNKEEVVCRMKAAVASKQFGQEDILSSLVADVIITCMPLFVIAYFLCQLPSYLEAKKRKRKEE